MTYRTLFACWLALSCSAQEAVLMEVHQVLPQAIVTGMPAEVHVVGVGLEEVVAIDSPDEGVVVHQVPADAGVKFQVSVPGFNTSGSVTIALKARGQKPQEIRLPCVPEDRLVREIEPNDEMDAAQALQVAEQPLLILGTGTADHDVFSFDGIEGMRLRVVTRLSGHTNGLTPSLVLYDADRTEVGRDVGGSGEYVMMSRTLPGGGRFYLSLQCTKTDNESERVSPGAGFAYSLEITASNDGEREGGRSIERLSHVTPERIARLLPVDERKPWLAYLEKSHAKALSERRVLAEELVTLGMKTSDEAPSGGSPPRIPSKRNAAEWLADPTTVALADSVLSYQTPSGGWSKAVKYSEGTRPQGTHWTTQSGAGWHYCGTLDNRATSTEILFLSAMHKSSGRVDFKEGALRGIRWVLDAQYPNGGWPQVYPLESGYHEHITFNDGAMLHALELMQEVATGGESFDWVGEVLRQECRESYEAGMRCLIQAQVNVGGAATVWCAQHDPLTLAPAAARLKEPASLSGGESADILRFLMREGPVEPPVTAAIEAAMRWFEANRITDLRQAQTAKGKTTYLKDPASTEVYWARFYHPTTFKPMFAGSDDGIVYDSFADMAAYNKVAYSFVTTRPGSVMNEKEIARWKKRLATAAE
ncbi:MAG: pectate lyase [Verrucomicrobiae bacterium]|nr:pectate lyase [Verrucomicrobiae bacterium]